jgi:hypothetical protein
LYEEPLHTPRHSSNPMAFNDFYPTFAEPTPNSS